MARVYTITENVQQSVHCEPDEPVRATLNVPPIPYTASVCIQLGSVQAYVSVDQAAKIAANIEDQLSTLSVRSMQEPADGVRSHP